MSNCANANECIVVDVGSPGRSDLVQERPHLLPSRQAPCRTCRGAKVIRALIPVAQDSQDFSFWQPEATDAAGVLLGKEALILVGGKQSVAPANVHPPTRQGRPGPHWTKDDL